MNFRRCFTAYLGVLLVYLVTFASFPPTLPVLIDSGSLITLNANPLRERLLGRARERKRIERVLLYLDDVQKKETDPWLRDDIRIAWITIKWAGEGVPEWAWHREAGPYAAATFQVLGCLPDQVWPFIVSARHAKLGSLYATIWGEESSPRKPVQSVQLKPRKNLAG
jgi:hypothetical protein